LKKVVKPLYFTKQFNKYTQIAMLEEI